MRSCALVLAGITLMLLAGCSPIRHHTVDAVEVGDPIYVVVNVDRREGQPSPAGTMFFLVPGRDEYIEEPMQQRGDELLGRITTVGLMPGDRVMYYLDIQHGGKLHALGSPARPFTVKVLSHDQYLEHKLSYDVRYGDDKSKVSFQLDADDLNVHEARVVYQMPGLGGEVHAPMQRVFNLYRLDIEKEHVQPGIWRYFIVAEIEGSTFRLPKAGYAQFEVRKAK